MVDRKLGYKITDKTLMHIASIERNLAILNQNEISAKIKYRVITESLFDDLFAINSFLNLNLTLADVKKLSIGREAQTTQERLLLNIRQIFDFIQNNYKKEPIVFNFQFVQHTIKLIQSDILEVWEVGKIRTPGETGSRLFETPFQSYAQVDTSSMLADAVQWIETDTELHPIVKACIFMMFLNTTSPFSGLNFVSSVVFFRIILEKYNYGNGFTLPIFKIFNKDNFKFKTVLSDCITKDDSKGMTPILDFISESLDELIKEYKKQMIHLDYFDIKTNSDQLDLNERQVKLLKLLQQKIYIKRKEYIKLFKVAPMTAYRDLNYLADKKLVIVSGQGKATKYTLTTMSN